MRVLLVIAHFFKAEANPNYSSTDGRQRERRRASLERVLLAWRAHCGEKAMLNVEHRMNELHPPVVDHLDIAAVVNDDNHLLDARLEKTFGVERRAFRLDQPRLLPFMAQKVMSENRERYDWFVYSEDDLLLHDPAIFAKLSAFQKTFGSRRVLQPNRFELNARAICMKTYIDGDLRSSFIERFLALVEEPEPKLVAPGAFGSPAFVRSRNPHSGFFALSAEQFSHWAAQKHFLDMDCSFVSPLESAATLGLLKTFSVFKPAPPNLHHFEIEHLDTKFSNLRLTAMHRGD